MPNNSHFAFALDKAKAAFGDRPVFENTRLPITTTNGGREPGRSYVTVPALWTKDGFRPQWKNLAVVSDELDNSDDLSWWNNILVGLGIPLGIFIVNDSFFLASSVGVGQTQIERVEPEDLARQLTQRNASLFTPKALSAFRSGQLSFADLEEGVTRESFSFHLRYQAQLARSLENAIAGAFHAELETQSRRRLQLSLETSTVFDSVLVVTIAFLAARILEDKGFFGSQQIPTDNIQALLERTVIQLNGFFEKALYKELPRVSDEALQRISVELGSRATFTLIDHHDVARFYEDAIRAPLEMPGIDLTSFRTPLLDLQQYYTPVAIAERMLDSLPLERMRPEDRRILDPSAGSGTLLLAASRRLAAMSDLPADKRSYLTNQVAGNDRDPNANLLTRIRYTLSQETVGIPLPAPSHFSSDDYESYTKETLANHPRVIVANPPFGHQDKVQRAIKFLNLVTEWLSDGDQFAVILPNTFLTGSTHGASQARRELAQRCHMFEVWTLPEGVVGVTARQAVCIVIGCIGKDHHVPTVVRATISSAMSEAAREQAYLAETWIAEVGETLDHWKALQAPPVNLPQSTLKLKDLYYLFTGVKLYAHFPPIEEPIEGITKPYWSLGWKIPGRIWADPQNRPKDKRYVRYGEEFMERPRLQNERLFDMPKIMVGRSVNRNAVDPLAACMDTEGLCPNVHVHCVVTWESKGTPPDVRNVPEGWHQLTDEQKLLWLLGILTSELACDISLAGRSARHLESPQLKDFPLPEAVDERIVEVVKQMLERDRNREPLPAPDPLRLQLNKLVEGAYGNPVHSSLVRTGVDADYEISLAEKTTPHITVTGQVRSVSPMRREILLWLHGINDESDEYWVPIPPEMPGWALDGDIFTADVSEDIETFFQLADRPRALRNFRHTPRPYLTIDELKEGLPASFDTES